TVFPYTTLFRSTDGFFLHQLLGQGQAVAGEDEVRVLGGALIMARFQLAQERLDRVQFGLDRRADAVPRQGGGQGAFADVLGVHDVRVEDVGDHALMLGALPGNPVELGQGQFQFAMVERLNGLHRALAEGLAAEDQRTVIVLHGSGEDLRGRGGQAVDQHGQRARVVDALVLVGQHVDTAIGVAYQHGGSLFDEQAGQLGGFLQGAAAVVAQVDDHAVDLLLLQLVEQTFDVTGGALVVRVAGAEGLEVEVEGRQFDHAELVVTTFVLELQHLLLGGLLFQLDRFAGDGDHLAGLVTGRIAGRDHFQAYSGAFRTTDQLDHFVQAPADHIDHFIVALGDADDLVGWCDLLALLGRAGRHQTYHLDVLVVALQNGTDAFERQTHVDVEVFRVVRRQIGGVRIVGGGEGIDVGLEHVLTTGLLEARQLVLVALGQQLLDVLGFLAGDLQAQHFVLDALAPEVVELGAILGPWGFLAVYLEVFVDAEVDLVDAFAQLSQCKVQALFQAGQMAAIDGEARLEVAAFQQIV